MLWAVREGNRLVAVVFEVPDLDRSIDLDTRAFGLELHLSDHHGGEHGEDDRWTSGRHAATTGGGARTTLAMP